MTQQLNWWQMSSQVEWTQCLLDSFRQWTGRELIDRSGLPQEQSDRLFFVPFVVVSHDHQDDPCLNYGNQKALELWEMEWEEFLRTPSRLTAEPLNQSERARMLQQAKDHGIITNYRGIRISRTGKRFLVDQATVWNVLDRYGQPCGQAAMFFSWSFLPDR